MGDRGDIQLSAKILQAPDDQRGIDAFYTIEAEIDEDGHLNVFITTNDGDKVHECDGDEYENGLKIRFTTKKIEERYRKMQKGGRLV